MLIRYEIEFWDKNDVKAIKTKGLAAGGNNIGEIINTLYNYYGNEIASLKFYECEDIIDDDELKEMIETNI